MPAGSRTRRLAAAGMASAAERRVGSRPAVGVVILDRLIRIVDIELDRGWS